MDPLDLPFKRSGSRKDNVLEESIREHILQYSKDFKTSWVHLGQSLYTVWKDKLYFGWGYEKFEYYTEKELGLKKQVALKLLKTYYFLEQEEPDYLRQEFSESRDASKVPGYETVNILRLAKQKKELLREDYLSLKKAVFEKGKDVAAVRKDLTAIIKERKQVDPEEERQERNAAAIRRLVNALKSFHQDMSALKIIPHRIIEQSSGLMSELETQLP